MPHASLEDALALATEEFKGTLDKAGQPYILHCLRVMQAQDSDDARQVGLLHDLVEDTQVTLDDLRRRGFSERVVSAVDAMTHRPDEAYHAYVLRLSQCPLAIPVKLADLHDNYRLDRVAFRIEHRPNDARRIQRYILTYQFLKQQIDQATYVAVMVDLDS